MGVPRGSVLGGIQVLAGIVAAYVPGLQALSQPLIVSGAATIAGSFIAHRPTGGKGGFGTSGTYGFDRAQNAAFEGAPRFFVLGKAKIAPSYINAFTEQDKADQVLYMQLYCGSGGIYGVDSVSDIEINGEPVANYKEVTTTFRTGTATQTTMPGYNKTAFQVNKDVNLVAKVKWHYTTQQEIAEVAFVIVFKSGLYKLKDDGIHWLEQRFSIKAKGENDDSWTRLKPPKEFATSSFLGNRDEDTGGHWIVEGRTTGVLRFIFRVPLNENVNTDWTTPQKFEFTIKPTEINNKKYISEATVSRVEEITYSDETYPGSSILGIRVKAQNQLEYDFPHVTCVIKGWKVLDPRTSTVAWTQNPALLTRAMLLDADDGCGDWIKSTDLWDGSGEDWRTVADYCDADAASSGDHKEDRFHLDLAVDSIQDAKDWLNHMLGTFRASLVEYGGKIGIVQDIPAAPVVTFDGRQTPTAGRRPILALPDGRPDIEWREVDTDQRANIVTAYYNDETEDYERAKTDEIKDTVRIAAGDPEVRKEVYAPGVTRGAQALREVRYSLNMDRLTPRVGSIGVGIGDLDLLPEDKILVYADTPKEFATGVTLRVVGVSYDSTNSGRIHFRKYNAGIYVDTSDTLPATPTWVTRATALANAAAAAPSASNVTLQEVDS